MNAKTHITTAYRGIEISFFEPVPRIAYEMPMGICERGGKTDVPAEATISGPLTCLMP